jgi:hypothetical protein
MMQRSSALAAAGGALLILLALPAVRQAMEASMWRHMIVQAPLWIAAGALVAGAAPERARRALAPWNVSGISGLAIATVTLALLMVPRTLDLALVVPEIEAAKLAALFATGAALRLSWRRASTVLQFFFLGNVLSMMAIAGMLYMNSPLRLCNAYLLDDQERLGDWLTTAAAVFGVAWLVWITLLLMQRENAYYATVSETAERERPAAPSAGSTGGLKSSVAANHDLPHAKAF